MATLQSPGVSVTVIDESFYTPAGAGTVPMIFVATGQDKANGSGTGIAQGTTAANAGKVWVITSQRDLTDTFGTPYFETDAEGNPVHGGELNEYGLQAAYSLLGVSSKAYVIRADVDSGSLTPTSTEPSGPPVNGTYWLDTATTKFGINEWNATTGKFTVQTPLIINNDNMNVALVDQDPNEGPVSDFGKVGNYAMVVTSYNTDGRGTNNPSNIVLWYKASGGWEEVKNTFNSGKKFYISPHFDYPDFTAGGLNAATGSVWVKATTPSQGADWALKYYNGNSGTWQNVSAPLFADKQKALQKLDNKTGGAAIPLGTVIVEYDTDNGQDVPTSIARANFTPWIRYRSSPTTISHANPTKNINKTYGFNIRETLTNGTWATPVGISVTGGATVKLGFAISNAINNNVSLVNVKADWDATTGRLTITHALGGDIEVDDTTEQCFTDFGFDQDVTANLYYAPVEDIGRPTWYATNWKPLVYEASENDPVTKPVDGQLWFSTGFEADIMYNNGLAWKGYLNAFPTTDPLGPTISATMPTTQQDGATPLANGDIWVDTNNPDEYGRNIYVYDGSAWALQDVTDSDTPTGWVFQDARWATTGTTTVKADIVDLLSSDYIDPDCPDPALYPRGTRLFNTRRSSNNIKKYVQGYINVNADNEVYNGESMMDYAADRWVTASPNANDGAGQFGRLAQRSVVTKALKAMVTANQAIRDTDTLNFNLIATPGYPELIQNMVAFNVDIGQTAFVVGDTPFRLVPTGTSLSEYGNNTVLAEDNNDAAAVTYDTGLAMFYPSGFTNDNLGNNIVVPPSHMMLRTILNSDNKSYLWFAPAGTRRGTVDNASSVGYVDNGEYKTVSLHQGLRDVMAGVKINPIATLPGVGLVNMGQYTRAQNASALDRVNVSRLIAYLRRQLAILAKPYLFEPNDSQTRYEVKAAVDALMTELVSQRALYDFLVVCDSTNNTPARIDRSELWVDIAIEPVKAVEFIYIPLRILNTGEIAASSK
jgi:hypothetical protein